MAKHRIGNGYTRVWGCDIIVDWADPQEEPSDETMSKVIIVIIISFVTPKGNTVVHVKQAVGGRPPRYAPAPLLSRGRRSTSRDRADGNVAAVSHGQRVPTPTAAAA